MIPSDRHVCIHGHFYQPPRENPWLEEIEVQDSAYPYHDWNERIALECYAPNAASRLLDSQQNIAEIINNYAKISFNFGPTLLTWMARHDPDTYRKILESDRVSRETRSGHGNALAQVYNHMIMPLANSRDKVTQVVWGIRDFQKRFGRPPEGLWLAETAVDTETLEILADCGIQFTILSPHQARRVRPLNWAKAPWQEVSGGRVDPSCPYRWISPRGLNLNLFFYDGPISRAIAFEGLLGDGEYLTGRLLDGFAEKRQRDQLVNVATDGESYGHHHRFGDMALAYALRKIERERLAVLTNYGEYLATHPSESEVEIVENSSWSCSHGVERWRSDCGCRIGTHANWNQRWREPLRNALNDLRDDLDAFYGEKAGLFLNDPWKARNDYIDVVFDRSPDTIRTFIERHQVRGLNDADVETVLKLLEMQRQKMFMFTSCGWFFDEISGLESVTVLLSAGRAVQLAQSLGENRRVEERFLKSLSRASSNIPELGDGAAVYERYVKPQVTDLPRVAAHQAVRGLFEECPEAGGIYCYSYRVLEKKTETSAGPALSVGRLRVTSDVTRESVEAVYAALHLGGHDFQCALRTSSDGSFFNAVQETLFQSFRRGSLTDLLAALRQNFEPRVFRLQDLFLEDRRRILGTVIEELLRKFDNTYRHLVEENRQLIEYLGDVNFPIPEAFRLAIRYNLDRDMRKILETLQPTPQEMDRLLALKTEAEKFKISLDAAFLADLIRKRVEAQLECLLQKPDPELTRPAVQWLRLAERLEVKLFLWRAENLFYELWNSKLNNSLDVNRPDDPAVQPFLELARRLHFKLPVGISAS